MKKCNVFFTLIILLNASPSVKDPSTNSSEEIVTETPSPQPKNPSFLQRLRQYLDAMSEEEITDNPLPCSIQ